LEWDWSGNKAAGAGIAYILREQKFPEQLHVCTEIEMGNNGIRREWKWEQSVDKGIGGKK